MLFLVYRLLYILAILFFSQCYFLFPKKTVQPNDNQSWTLQCTSKSQFFKPKQMLDLLFLPKSYENICKKLTRIYLWPVKDPQTLSYSILCKVFVCFFNFAFSSSPETSSTSASCSSSTFFKGWEDSGSNFLEGYGWGLCLFEGHRQSATNIMKSPNNRPEDRVATANTLYMIPKSVIQGLQ